MFTSILRRILAASSEFVSWLLVFGLKFFVPGAFHEKEAETQVEIRSMLRRLVRRPLSLAIVGVLVGIPVVGGAAMVVSEEFRSQVEARVASALPGTVVGGCEIKAFTRCPNANLSGAYLEGVNLFLADLSRAYLYQANLSGANLRRANLSMANLYQANLSGADLRGANLSRAYLWEANLSGANLTGANLSEALFFHTRMPDGSIRNEG